MYYTENWTLDYKNSTVFFTGMKKIWKNLMQYSVVQQCIQVVYTVHSYIIVCMVSSLQ